MNFIFQERYINLSSSHFPDDNGPHNTWHGYQEQCELYTRSTPSTDPKYLMGVFFLMDWRKKSGQHLEVLGRFFTKDDELCYV